MRLLFLGSPPFAGPVLDALLASPHEVCGLVTRPDRPRGRGRSVALSPLAEAAQAHGVPVFQPESTRDESVQAELRALEPEVLVVASYGEILREPMLQLAPHGALNVHASLLPRHRGASPIQAAILAGDAATGVSVQRMVLALDKGDVVQELATPIGSEETAGELFDRLAVLGGRAAVEALDLIESGAVVFRPQDDALATYAGKLEKSAGRVDWSQSAEEVDRRRRAMHPWPGATTTAPDGKPLTITAARIAHDVPAHDAAPGSLLETKPRCLVACGSGALELLEVKPAGSRAMPADAWLRGARCEVGARLGDPSTDSTEKSA
ncbi:MAG: methionyl-tRNA formyltransferase [Planctomycetes bacterium]|nr:methionyl-tRNA formyltransferase [Planctomycetota bacterium]MCB9905135.1 methionyl-tRNA formyltransferase [Planctomycetota bacterium]